MDNFELKRAAKALKIPYFIGFYSCDTLPVKEPQCFEIVIVNSDDSEGFGSHWMAYVKQLNPVDYYNSFGNLKPPQELLKYFGSRVNITYS